MLNIEKDNKDLAIESKEDFSELDEIAEDVYTDFWYEVWAFGYDAAKNLVDSFLIGWYDNPDEALACARNISFLERCRFKDSAVVYSDIEVETVVTDLDNKDATMNIGTIFRASDINIISIKEHIDFSESDFKINDEGNYLFSLAKINALDVHDFFTLRVNPEDTPLLFMKLRQKGNASCCMLVC